MDLGLSGERETDQAAPDGAGSVQLPGDPRHRIRSGRLTERGVLPPDDADALDRLAPFRAAVLGVRWGTAGVGLVLTAVNSDHNSVLTWIWCVVIIAQAAYRVARPVRYVDHLSGTLVIGADTALCIAAVATTGGWNSPFVFSLLTPIIMGGFARGFPLGMTVAAVSVGVVGAIDAIDGADLRLTAQWASEFVLVALVAGYARRILGEADRQQSLALDRLGRLADANALLYSLHRVAQSLPASLDLDEALDSTMGRLRDLFEYSSAAILLYEETDRGWAVVRRDGSRPPERIEADDLPPPLVRAVRERGVVFEPNLLVEGGPGLAPRMYSGIYAVLRTRGASVGLLSLEHAEPNHFTARDAELLEGVAEPAALAIDNARWFARLRTLGAEEERTRIARELHDRIGQSLAYLAFELDRIVKSDSKGEDVGKSLEQLRSDIRDVIREVRDTLYDLRTDVSDEQDMAQVLEMYLQRVRDRSGLEINFRSNVTGRLPVVQERELFRVAQEALANVEKHANASVVTISWRCDGTDATLEVADDGKGFPIGTTGRMDSYGIIGMRERAASIGARLDVDSSPGIGTRVRCRLGAVEPVRTSLLSRAAPGRPLRAGRSG
jgi:signal transduction histidine kinase